MNKLNENDIEEIKELVNKWNKDIISLEEVRKVLACINGHNKDKAFFEPLGVVETIKNKIDEQRKQNYKGEMIKLHLFVHVDEAGTISLEADGYDGFKCQVMQGNPAKDSNKYLYPFISIRTTNSNGMTTNICFDLNGENSITMLENYTKNDLMNEIKETILFDGRTIEMEKRYYKKNEKCCIIDYVKIVEPDRVYKSELLVDEYFYELEKKGPWITDKDLRSGLGTLSERDLPRYEEANSIMSDLEEGKCFMEKEGTIYEYVVYPSNFDDDTLTQALLEEKNESFRDEYRQYFEKRKKEKEADITQDKIVIM